MAAEQLSDLQLAFMSALWEAGVTFFKVFTCTTLGVPGFDAAHLLQLFREVAEYDGLCLVHCEDETITERTSGRSTPVGTFTANMRPPQGEVTSGPQIPEGDESLTTALLV